MPMRLITTACPGEYGPKVVIDLPIVEKLPEAGVELLSRLAGNRIVRLDRAPLLENLARRIEPDNSSKAFARKPIVKARSFLFHSVQHRRHPFFFFAIKRWKAASWSCPPV